MTRTSLSMPLAALLLAACPSNGVTNITEKPAAAAQPAPAEAAAPSVDPSALPTVTFHTEAGDVVVLVEIADTQAERARGLMHRKSLEPDHGMVFVFPEEAEHPFWMQNTYIALDMIFAGADNVVVGVVANAEPLTVEHRTVGKPSKLVVEVNAGFAAKHGIGAGTRLSMQNVPQAAER